MPVSSASHSGTAVRNLINPKMYIYIYLSIYLYVLKLYRDNGKENGNYYSPLGLYRDNGNKVETRVI